MPRYADPALPAEAEAAVHTLGINRVRLAILVELARSGPLSTSKLAAELPANTMTVNRHLLELEEAGAVTASKPPEDPARRRSPIVWTLQPQVVRDALREVLDLL